MYIALMVIAGSIAVDLLWTAMKPLWRRTTARTALAGALLFLVVTSSAYLLASTPRVFTIVLLVISLYRALNYTRIALGRMNHHALRAYARRSILWLDGAQLLVLGCWLLWEYTGGLSVELLYGTWAAGALLISVFVFGSTLRNLRRTKIRTDDAQREHLTTSTLPTITVAIPARNETNNLITCLESVVSSEYPKLEILALDDSSHTKRTPEIIRSFAHKGVRFLQGDNPRDGWLAKNQAYDTLAGQANGEYLLFMGVDIELAPESIRALVDHLHNRGKKMLSVMPLRYIKQQSKGLSLSQAARYMWELAPPRRLFQRPPVLSSVWLIEKRAFLELGGMAAVKRSVTPEAYFARMLAKSDAYGFVRSNKALGVTSHKSLADQRDTAIRVRYPALHKHIEFVALLTLGYCLVLLGPLALVVGSLLGELSIYVGILGLTSLTLFGLAFTLVVTATRLSPAWLAMPAFPFAVLRDIAITHASLWGYEFGSVTWKQRNTVEQVMEVSKHLPKI